MKSIISISILVGSLFFFTINIPKKNTKRSFQSYVNFIEARAKTLLSSTPDLTSSQGVADFIRYSYFAINGATDNYEIEQGDGFLEVINSILGSDGIGGILGSKGYATCSSIPTSGSLSGTVSGGGQSMDVQFAFGTGIRKIPSHFPHYGGENYDVSIKITTITGKYYVELKCSSEADNITTAYIYSLLSINGSDTINEAFYQKNEDTNATYVDFYLKDNGYNIIDLNRFTTADGSNFSIYHMRYLTTTSSGSAFAITGTANEKVNVNAVTITGMSGDVVSKNIYSDLSGSSNSGSQTINSACISLTSNSTTTGCASLSSTTSVAIDSSTYAWNFDSMKTFSTSTTPF